MEQNKRMLEDRDTNFVYLSEWLEKEHPEFFSELTTLTQLLPFELFSKKFCLNISELGLEIV